MIWLFDVVYTMQSVYPTLTGLSVIAPFEKLYPLIVIKVPPFSEP